jgi:hypothetical protein
MARRTKEANRATLTRKEEEARVVERNKKAEEKPRKYKTRML